MPNPLSQRRRYHPRVIELERRVLPSTFRVTTTADSGPGSLRQAILDNNATPGLNSIAFNIGAGGVQTVRPTSALPTVTNPVVIDGTTQPGYAGAPLIELTGGSAGRSASGLFINVDGCTVMGLVINGFSANGLLMAGNNAVVQGNYLGTDVTGTRAVPNGLRGLYLPFSHATVGGTTAAARNVISGNAGDGIADEGGSNLFEGNYIGTDVTGTHSLGNGQDGIDLRQDFSPTVGGAEPGAGNVISGNTGDGIDAASGHALIQGNTIGTDATGTAPLGNGTGIAVDSSFNQVGGSEPGAGNLISGNRTGILIGVGGMNQVQGNFIGTDVTGIRAVGNGTGVQIDDDAIYNTIGGAAAGAGNLVSGNQGDGVLIGTFNNVIQGNRIGTDVTGAAPLGNGTNGVEIVAGAYIRGYNTTVGGATPGAGNTIAFNGNDGVRVAHGNGNLVSRNAIFADGRLGIEVMPGANNNTSLPVLHSATVSHGRITIAGSLQSLPDTTFTLELFGNDACNPSGFGEGQRFLGDTGVTTDDGGGAAFTVTLPVAGVDPGRYLSATATDPANNTSAFSACLAISRPSPQVEALGTAVPVVGTAEPPPYLPAAPLAPAPRPVGTPSPGEDPDLLLSAIPVSTESWPRVARVASAEAADAPALVALFGWEVLAP